MVRTNTWAAPVTLLLATGGLLGVSTNLAKLAGAVGLDPLAFLAWSVVGAAVVLVGVCSLRNQLPSLNARTIEYFVVSGLVGVAAPNLLFFAAVPRVGAAFVALAVAFPPLFTYLGALLLRLERFQTTRAAGVVLALGGAALLAALKLSEPAVDTFWVAATLTAPILLAGGNIYRTVRWPPGATPEELAPGMLATSGVMLLGVGAIAGLSDGGSEAFSLTIPTDHLAPTALVIAQAATFSLMYLLYFSLQKRGGPVYLSLLGSVGAVVGVPVAVVLLGEAPPQGLAGGSILIALGVGLVTLGSPKGG
ncbi:EamA/RhaT family transporter [Haloferax mediterranei ATCC 33500]|uniref:EamA/RhaT family transporter n=1 Tax=Haloferax mediterranei (strain ATCC 33500 / DSM 1411 / JCM 8866 / NBRC 14739 / NCIMB 2177 / R-4) TaxID=523841 RepID=I3R2L7_HALMT|nr:EamA family transporter [Haloferax mediterranei]AFK18477.1 membrane protein [Haloferax mediterranei ATCC 33500]AHZ22140.1 membrane protein [Haloferax mediterranei ATCC 33500]EMA02249.1 membrane protein [Haloferax mediterranei ATCC 33500]MDX5988568.1 EamA family transporter [Haloferax mediterranei ATCC 33500]QCQ74981.1 EamA/RhaT family transporter [Haloferax mediterranei ATCC 33500]